MRVFVLDKNLQPLDPCHPARARKLLNKGKAKVFKHYPFTIVLQDRTVEESIVHAHRLKIDPGSKITGIAIIQEITGRVTNAIELWHRGQQIKKALDSRKFRRNGRRKRKTRYRKPRYKNRRLSKRWLSPSIKSRIYNIETWVKRLKKICPILSLSQETTKFDTQKMQNPEIKGEEYQKGELYGFEIKEYLLLKWERKCAYCDKENVPFQIEHIIPRSKGGSNRVSNLCISCQSCNQLKSNRDIKDFLKNKPEKLKKILHLSQRTYRDAEVINITRSYLYNVLTLLGLEIEIGTGGLTKYNRYLQNLEKSHWIDAACVGQSTPKKLLLKGVKPLIIKAKGHGLRQRCRPDKYGFPKSYAPRAKFFLGYQTGDIVKAELFSGKFKGKYIGRISIRFRPHFNLQTKEKSFDIHPKYLRLIQKADGYAYL